VLQVLQHRRKRQTPGTFAFAPFGRLLRPAVAYGDGYSISPPSQESEFTYTWDNIISNQSASILEGLQDLLPGAPLSERALRVVGLPIRMGGQSVCPLRPTLASGLR
jgi:hypothetical protein